MQGSALVPLPPHRPPSSDISRIDVRGVPPALRKRLRMYAADNDIPMSKVVIAALEAYLP